MTDNSCAETNEKHLKKIAKHNKQCYLGSDASERDSDESSKKSSRGHRKGRRRCNASFDSDHEKHIERARKAQKDRRHGIWET